jgi:hypothetical protein
MMCFGRPSCPCGQASRGRPLYPRNGTAALHFCAGVPVRLGPYRQQVPTPTGHLCDFTASLAPRKRATALTQRANAGRGGGAPSCRCCTCGKAEPQPFRRLKQSMDRGQPSGHSRFLRWPVIRAWAARRRQAAIRAWAPRRRQAAAKWLGSLISGDHVFCIVIKRGRSGALPTISEMKDNFDWSEGVVIDPWLNVCCAASDYASNVANRLDLWGTKGKRILWKGNFYLPTGTYKHAFLNSQVQLKNMRDAYCTPADLQLEYTAVLWRAAEPEAPNRLQHIRRREHRLPDMVLRSFDASQCRNDGKRRSFRRRPTQTSQFGHPPGAAASRFQDHPHRHSLQMGGAVRRMNG